MWFWDVRIKLRGKMSIISNIVKGIKTMFVGLDEKNVISVVELNEAIKIDKELVLVDVRNPDELQGPLGKINNVINIPLGELTQRLNELEKYRENKIAVICQSGGRSMMATKMLMTQGFNAINVSGGMIQYRSICRN